MAKVIYLIRGLPGAGKSTLAEHIVERCCRHAADDYFMVEQGKGKFKYVFDRTKLPEAHIACLNAVKKNIADCQPKIVVANTFVKKEHMKPYYDLAAEHGYEVVEIIVKSNFRSIHGVPQSTIDKMREEFEV